MTPTRSPQDLQPYLCTVSVLGEDVEFKTVLSYDEGRWCRDSCTSTLYDSEIKLAPLDTSRYRVVEYISL